MLPIEPKSLISRFIAEVSPQFPNVSGKQFDEVCRSVFNFIKFCMRSSSLPEIRIKYWGKYSVRLPRAKAFLTKLEKGFLAGRVPQDRYEEKKEILLNYISKKETEIEDDDED